MATSEHPIERIDFIYHGDDEPELIASFFWSEAFGLRGTNAFLLEELERIGIVLPDGAGRVFPRDGRPCFEALQWRATSLIEVTPARPATSAELP